MFMSYLNIRNAHVQFKKINTSIIDFNAVMFYLVTHKSRVVDLCNPEQFQQMFEVKISPFWS